MVDTNKESVKFHSENALILDKWTGDVHDKTLWDLIHFLQSMYRCNDSHKNIVEHVTCLLRISVWANSLIKGYLRA